MSTRAAIATAPGSSDLVVRGAVASAVVGVGVLVGAADELVDADVLTLVAAPQTERTYRRACRRLVDWLGPLAGPEDGRRRRTSPPTTRSSSPAFSLVCVRSCP